MGNKQVSLSSRPSLLFVLCRNSEAQTWTPSIPSFHGRRTPSSFPQQQGRKSVANLIRTQANRRPLRCHLNTLAALEVGRILGPGRNWLSQPSFTQQSQPQIHRQSSAVHEPAQPWDEVFSVEGPCFCKPAKMEPNQQWSWQHPQGGFAPPMPNILNPNAMPFNMPWGVPMNPTFGWVQPAAHGSIPQATQPSAQKDHGRGQEKYLTPSQKRRQRHRRKERSASEGAEDRGNPESRVPISPVGPGQLLPFPTGSAAMGPFAGTRPVLQDSPLTGYTHTAVHHHPLAPEPASAIPGLAATATPTSTTALPPPPLPPSSTSKRANKPPRSPPSPQRDAISAPSAASGGIPEPTSAYLLRASFLPLTAPAPRPILVVIDLNGTLLYRPSKRFPSKFVERPLAREFLRSCIDKHRVVIWSSARPDNVRRMCAQLLPREYLARVVAVWGRDRFGLSDADYNRRTQCYKRLTRLWSDPVVAASHPRGGVWNQGNTVLIDDSAEKARSEPHNAITLPEFAGDRNERPPVLSLVQEYLDTLTSQMDVSTYIRARPFNVRMVE
ncbi:hypothetical protein VTK56DRAFT_139 [Thermocarpiscus australiensis]